MLNTGEIRMFHYYIPRSSICCTIVIILIKTYMQYSGMCFMGLFHRHDKPLETLQTLEVKHILTS